MLDYLQFQSLKAHNNVLSYGVSLSHMLLLSIHDVHQAMTLRETEPMVNTFVHKVKDIEFPDIISVSKSNIIDFRVLLWICFCQKMVIFTV
jgi:hypothetical protein